MGVPLPRRHVPVVHPSQFGQTDRRLHFGHAVVPTDPIMDVRQLLFQFQQVQPFFNVITVIAETACFPGQLFVIRGEHAPFAAGGEGFVLAKTARRQMADRARLAALVGTAKRLGVVFDDDQIVLLRQLHDRVHVTDVPVKVDRNDRLGSRGDELFDRLDADAVVVDVDVGESRDRPGLDDGKAGRDEGIAGNDHLIARSDSGRGQRYVQGGGSTIDANREIAPLPLGKFQLKLLSLGPGPVVHLAAAKDLFHRFDGLFAHLRPRGKALGYALRTTVNR